MQYCYESHQRALVHAVFATDGRPHPHPLPPRVRSATQTQTEQDSRSRANPDSILGFDNWHDIPPDVAQFLSYAGATMEAELEKSDASQVRITRLNEVCAYTLERCE